MDVKGNAPRSESMREFMNLLQKYPKIANPHIPENRFVCINRLGQAVKLKRGKYTEKERQDWLSILYACLRAPNCYFGGEEGHPRKKMKNHLKKYEGRLTKFQQAVVQEESRHRFIYTFLSCIRDFLNITNYYTYKHNVEYEHKAAGKLQEGVRQALNERILQRPALKEVNDEYERVLKETFQEHQGHLNHPIIALFLPYYLFFQLGKCEGLIDSRAKEAFSLPELSENGYTWTIRQPIIASQKESDLEQLDDLYDLIETALNKTLNDLGYHSIGESYLSAACRYINQNGGPDTKRIRRKPKFNLSIEYSAHFSVPLWSYDVWIQCFCKQYDMEPSSMLSNMNDIFSLLLRPSSEPAKCSAEKILSKYGEYCREINGKGYKLSELLKALCDIYNPQFFNAVGPFKDITLRKSVALLIDFLVGVNDCPSEMRNNSVDEKWLWLIEHGCPMANTDKVDSFGSVVNRLVNPSRILYHAIRMSSLVKQIETPQRYILSAYYPYSESVKLISNALNDALPSEKAILHDVAYWGGVKIKFDRKYVRNFADVLQIWSVWNKDGEERFSGLYQNIKNKAEELDAALIGLQPLKAKPVTVYVSDLESDPETSEILLEQKQKLFMAVPVLKTIFGKPNGLDDFQYAFILYLLFRVLRDHMCRQAFSLSTKLLKLI